MGKPTYTLHKKLKDLWPANGRAVIRAGAVTIQFQKGGNGKRVKITSKRGKPTYKLLQDDYD